MAEAPVETSIQSKPVLTCALRADQADLGKIYAGSPQHARRALQRKEGCKNIKIVVCQFHHDKDALTYRGIDVPAALSNLGLEHQVLAESIVQSRRWSRYQASFEQSGIVDVINSCAT
jgi:hypothetical protein